MKILIINAILYTAENKHIEKVKTIKDTMIYDLCLAFCKSGHNVVLYAGEPYKPIQEEDYPFDIIWGKCIFKSVFFPHRFPFMWGLYTYIKKNKEEIDLIISSEVFSMGTLQAYCALKEKLISWHEIAKHQSFMRKIPSKFWYSFIVKYFMKNLHVVARSAEAKEFIKKYCINTEEIVIDHGVNLDLFRINKNKDNSFIVCSQLIERKRIDLMIIYFNDYLKKYDKNCLLYIIGDGELKESLVNKVNELGIQDSVKIMGKLSHRDLIPFLARAKALLVNTIKDNNMISIIEAIAVGTPVITTDTPLNASYIKKYSLGIVKEQWSEEDLYEISSENMKYVENCIYYRERLSTIYKVEQFIDCYKSWIK